MDQGEDGERAEAKREAGSAAGCMPCADAAVAGRGTGQGSRERTAEIMPSSRPSSSTASSKSVRSDCLALPRSSRPRNFMGAPAELDVSPAYAQGPDPDAARCPKLLTFSVPCRTHSYPILHVGPFLTQATYTLPHVELLNGRTKREDGGYNACTLAS